MNLKKQRNLNQKEFVLMGWWPNWQFLVIWLPASFLLPAGRVKRSGQDTNGCITSTWSVLWCVMRIMGNKWQVKVKLGESLFCAFLTKFIWQSFIRIVSWQSNPQWQVRVIRYVYHVYTLFYLDSVFSSLYPCTRCRSDNKWQMMFIISLWCNAKWSCLSLSILIGPIKVQTYRELLS